MDQIRRLFGRGDDGGPPAQPIDMRHDPEEGNEDPPFVYRDPVDRSGLNRVMNDVYTRNSTGKKWHRIYGVGYAMAGSNNERLASYGRSFIFPCGGAGSESEPSADWSFRPMPLLAGVPDEASICKACRQSDAKYGKGDIANRFRWDR
jgi:hypothetical protein